MALFMKIVGGFVGECRERGFYIAFLMYATYAFGILRGFMFKIFYFRSLHSALFVLQANSRIEIFNRKASVKIGKFVFIRKNASIRVDRQGDLKIEDKVFINDNCNINCVHKIEIGAFTKIGPNVCINDHDHDYKHATEDHLKTGEVMIGKHVWIGSHVVILKNTRIGDYAVIGAGSVVKGEVPTNTLFVNERENKFIPFQEMQGRVTRGIG